MGQERIRPASLRPGDTIGIVSPSWFGGEPFRRRAEQGARQLRNLGFEVSFASHALSNRGWVSDTAANRAADLHAMFADPNVRMALSTIGGDHACHLLPLLDWELIRANPKIFMGFSDISVLNLAIWSMTGLGTFNGPALMTDWAEFPEMPDYARRHALGLLCRVEPLGSIEPAESWTEEFLDWSTGQDLLRPRRREPSDGWAWVRGGQAGGVLIGGCLESLQHLRGTRYWPDLSDAILFLETSEERPSPAKVDGILMDYENMGVLERSNGLLFARPYGYSDDDRAALVDVLRERTRAYGFPVVANMDFGHTSPIFTVPIGCRAEIDGERQRFAIVEAAVT